MKFGLLPFSVRRRGTEYFIKVTAVESTGKFVENTESGTTNSVFKKLEFNLIKYYDHV